MKHVVLKVSTPQIAVADVKSSKYYGVEVILGVRGFITRETHGKGNFVIRSFTNLTSANGWPFADAPTLMACVESCLKQDAPVREFETIQELVAWCS